MVAVHPLTLHDYSKTFFFLINFMLSRHEKSSQFVIKVPNMWTHLEIYFLLGLMHVILFAFYILWSLSSILYWFYWFANIHKVNWIIFLIMYHIIICIMRYYPSIMWGYFILLLYQLTWCQIYATTTASVCWELATFSEKPNKMLFLFIKGFFSFTGWKQRACLPYWYAFFCLSSGGLKLILSKEKLV